MAMIELKLLILVIIANGMPLLGTVLFGQLFAHPLDHGLKLSDGKRLFGNHVTVRGVVLAIAITTLTAQLTGVPAADGAIIACAAMAGDALSSLIKRRMDIQPGGMAVGLDQIPESFLPLLAMAGSYNLSLPIILALCTVFLLFDLLVSRLLYHYRWRSRPY